jgi:hypothetical protein
MKKKIKELNDEETYSIENGDEINEGIYSLTYDTQYEDYFSSQLDGLMEQEGYLQYLVHRYEKAEVNLKTIDNLIIKSIGKESYDDIIDLIKLQKMSLSGNIIESRKEFDDVWQSAKNFGNSNI